MTPHHHFIGMCAPKNWLVFIPCFSVVIMSKDIALHIWHTFLKFHIVDWVFICSRRRWHCQSSWLWESIQSSCGKLSCTFFPFNSQHIWFQCYQLFGMVEGTKLCNYSPVIHVPTIILYQSELHTSWYKYDMNINFYSIDMSFSESWPTYTRICIFIRVL